MIEGSSPFFMIGMLPMRAGILKTLGLPEAFGQTLLVIGLILIAAPYVSGVDLGLLQVPSFDPNLRTRPRWIGPIFFVAALVIHFPIVKQRSAIPSLLHVGRVTDDASGEPMQGAIIHLAILGGKNASTDDKGLYWREVKVPPPASVSLLTVAGDRVCDSQATREADVGRRMDRSPDERRRIQRLSGPAAR